MRGMHALGTLARRRRGTDVPTAYKRSAGAFVVVGLMQRHCNWSDRTEYLCRLLEQVTAGPEPKRPSALRKAPRSAKKRPPDLRAAIVADYQAGETVGELATKYAVHRISVSNYLDEVGVARRPRDMTTEQVRKAVQLYERGDSLATIGAARLLAAHR